jgi:Mg2+ and Co2+ transporter CorA
VLKQQQKVLSDYRYRLDPETFKTASGHRRMRFAYEKKNIDKFIETLRERSSYCAELKERARELAVQNVQLVETLQDDSNKAILMFTIVAVIFLPLSFVSGYFGMNFPDLTGTKKHSSHFWTIAAPLTSGILILCVIISVKGEQIFFAIGGSLRWMKTVALVGRKEKAA